MADFTVKVCRAPDTCGPEGVQQPRADGLADDDVTSLVEIIAPLNITDRMLESMSTIE